MTSVRFVLASASPRRAAVLRQLGLDPVVLPAELDESHLPGESPDEHVERLAREKAATVSLQEPGALVLAGDTVVVDRGRLLGKPASEAAAVAMLASLAGRAHEVLTGLALAGEHGVTSGVARTVVRFRGFDEDAARRYVRTGEPLDKAGAYGIQAMGAALVSAVEGDYTCVVGLPVSLFVELLERAGWRYDFGELTKLSPP